MRAAAPYDEVADWYENEFLVLQRSLGDGTFADRLGIDEALVRLLGSCADEAARSSETRTTLGPATRSVARSARHLGVGSGRVLEVGCGTGIYADRLADLGWTPLGVDLSSAMLRYAADRLPVTQGDACRLPFASASLDAVVAIMVHTDMPDYPSVLAEIHRVLKPGGALVHVGVHPCFCGGFADRTNPDAVVIAPGYLDGEWTTDSWTSTGLRDKVGAAHFPLPELLNTFIAAGFVFEEFSEGAEPVPVVLSMRVRKDHG